MSRSPQPVFTAAAAILFVLAACQNPTESRLPVQVTAAVRPAARACPGDTGGPSFLFNNFEIHPVGNAVLSINNNGELVVRNVGKNGKDGFCAPLAGVHRATLEVANGFWALPEPGDEVIVELSCVSPLCGGSWIVGLRRNANGNLRGWVDGPCSSTHLTISRNGSPLRSKDGGGRIGFPVPKGFLLHDVGTGDGIMTMGGTLGNGDSWGAAAACVDHPVFSVAEALEFRAKLANGSRNLVIHSITAQ